MGNACCHVAFVLGFTGNPGRELAQEMASWRDSIVGILARVVSVSSGDWLNAAARSILWSCPLHLSPQGQKVRTRRRTCWGSEEAPKEQRGKAVLRSGMTIWTLHTTCKGER